MWKFERSESICRQKKKKNEFEKLLLASAGPYLEQGERAAAEMKASSYEKLRAAADEEGAVCHGEFSQHNILLENGRGETAVNFDKWNFDLQVADLGYFMRKILEKHGWSERAAERILNAYSARRPLDEGEIGDTSPLSFLSVEILETGKPLLRSQEKIVDIRAEYGETKNTQCAAGRLAAVC